MLKHLLFVVVCTVPFSGAHAADFLLVTNPQAVVLFNKYETRLSSEQKSELGTNLPFKIEKKETTLGDGITPAARVSLNGTVYYLLRDNDGGIIGARNGASLYRNCHVAGKMVEAASGAALYPRYPSSGSPQKLSVGTELKIIFTYSGMRFAKVSEESAYGWLRGKTNKPAQAQAATYQPGQTSDRFLTQRIMSRIEEANKDYRLFFGHFNEFTGKDKTIPEWQCSPGGTGLRCVLEGPKGVEKYLKNSTAHLVQDLKEIALGRSLEVRYEHSELLIRKREQ